MDVELREGHGQSASQWCFAYARLANKHSCRLLTVTVLHAGYDYVPAEHPVPEVLERKRIRVTGLGEIHRTGL
eukprot:697367-Amphidinium_carterae.1